MLTELENGYSPTFYFNDSHSPFDRIAAALSPIRFTEMQTQFNQCISQLLPFSFEDIMFTSLSYESASDDLTKASQKRLQQLALYLKYDKDIESVTVDAFSDSFGGSAMNETLSLKRANAIKDILVGYGLEAERIDVTGFGERRHIASNETALGRAKNRRVVIQMEKP